MAFFYNLMWAVSHLIIFQGLRGRIGVWTPSKQICGMMVCAKMTVLVEMVIPEATVEMLVDVIMVTDTYCPKFMLTM